MIFVPFVCLGDPSTEFTFKLVKTLEPYSDMIEIGIPFSDPIADGKTIQGASQRALKNGTKPKQAFLLAKKLRKNGFSKPLIFMTYYNIVFSFGKENFLKKMKQSGADSLLVVDLPFGEDKEFENLAKKHGVGIVNLVTESTGMKRAKKILLHSDPFTYIVSAKGVTGARQKISRQSLSFVKKIRKIAGKNRKLLVGFGISEKRHAKGVLGFGADGVIIGSKLIDIYSRYIKDGQIDTMEALNDAEVFAKSIKAQKTTAREDI